MVARGGSIARHLWVSCIKENAMLLRSSRSAFPALGIGAALVTGLTPGHVGAQSGPQQLPPTLQPDRAAPPAPQFERGDPRGFDRRADRIEPRLQFLRAELRITPALQPLWDAFADTVRREAAIGRDQIADRAGALRRPDDRFQPPSVVERLERRQQNLLERSEHYDRLLAALRPLYAALSEDQRQAADDHLFSLARQDRFRRGPRRFGWEREFGGPREPFGPYPPFERFNPYDR
jgi:hypothetical protein